MHEFKSALEAAFGIEQAGMAEVQVDQLDGRSAGAPVAGCGGTCYCRAEQPVMGSICRVEQPVMGSICRVDRPARPTVCRAEQPMRVSFCRAEQPVPVAG